MFDLVDKAVANQMIYLFDLSQTDKHLDPKYKRFNFGPVRAPTANLYFYGKNRFNMRS